MLLLKISKGWCLKLLVVFTMVIPMLGTAQSKKNVPTKAVVKSIKPTGHAIQITLKPYQNSKIYIGTNYGKSRVLADSTLLNEKSEGVFESSTPLTPGIYFVVSPSYSILFDFLVDSNQFFKIIGDTSSIKKYEIVGSKENILFRQYSESMNEMGLQMSQLKSTFSSATNAKDSALLLEQFSAKSKDITDKRKRFMKEQPNSMTAFLLNVMERPEVPAIPIVNGKADSSYPYYFVKNHFWDNVVFNDNRLIRTPFFEEKLDFYFQNYVSRDPDSIIDEVQYMLTVAKTGKEIFPFLLFKFTNKYISPEFMGQDKVFLHIYQNFFAKGDTVLLNEASKRSITDRAYSIMANQLGLAAPALVLNDLQNKKISLYDIKSPYTFVAFWDPTCSHCKVEIPRLDSFYKAVWKNLNVRVLSVNINFKEVASWKKFIADNKMEGWINAYQTEEDLNKEIKEGKPTTIRQLYDVFKTPTYYLLDVNKKIVAKNLSIEQFNDYLMTTRNKSK